MSEARWVMFLPKSLTSPSRACQIYKKREIRGNSPLAKTSCKCATVHLQAPRTKESSGRQLVEAAMAPEWLEGVDTIE